MIFNLKRGELLIENIIFIVLNLIFITILVVFLFMKSGDTTLLEEKYAKEIALIIDSLSPVSDVEIDMSDALSKADENYKDNMVNINGNIVTVKLTEKGGGSYSFFNDVNAKIFPSGGPKYTLKILEKGDFNNE